MRLIDSGHQLVCTAVDFSDPTYCSGNSWVAPCPCMTWVYQTIADTYHLCNLGPKSCLGTAAPGMNKKLQVLCDIPNHTTIDGLVFCSPFSHCTCFLIAWKFLAYICANTVWLAPCLCRSVHTFDQTPMCHVCQF